MPDEVLAVRVKVPASARTLIRSSNLGAGRTVRESDMGNLDNLLDLLGCQLALPLHRKLGRTVSGGHEFARRVRPSRRGERTGVLASLRLRPSQCAHRRYATWLMRSTPWMPYSGLWGRSLSPPPDRPLRIESPAPMDQGSAGIGSERSERVGEEDGGLAV